MKNKTFFATGLIVLSVWVVVMGAYATQIRTDLSKGKSPKMIPFDGGSCSSTTTTSTSE
jgi:hypothetical protein